MTDKALAPGKETVRFICSDRFKAEIAACAAKRDQTPSEYMRAAVRVAVARDLGAATQDTTA